MQWAVAGGLSHTAMLCMELLLTRRLYELMVLHDGAICSWWNAVLCTACMHLDACTCNA